MGHAAGPGEIKTDFMFDIFGLREQMTGFSDDCMVLYQQQQRKGVNTLIYTTLDLVGGQLAKRIDEIVSADMAGEQKQWMEEGRRYYAGHHDILGKDFTRSAVEETALNDDGKEVETVNVFSNPNRSNHKNINPFHRILVDQKTAYLTGREPSVSAKEGAPEKMNDFLTRWADEKFALTIQDMTTEAANKGFSAAHIYYDEEGKLGYALIPSEQLIPIFDSTDREVLAGMIRYYQKPVVENGQRKMKSMVEYWTEETVTIFTKNEGGREWKTWEKPHWVSVSQQEGKSLAHGWGRPPFLLLKNNADMTGDLTLIKGLIDAYDLISSEGTNDFLDLVGLYWAVCGYSGETAKAIARKLQVNRAVNVSDASGSIEARQVNLPVEGRIEFLRMLRRDIFHFGMGIDVDSELFGTSPSGVSLKFRYAQLDLKANAIAVRLKRLIREMARFFIEDHNRRNGDSWDWKDVEVSLNRTMITNDKETVEMIASSQGLVSRRTLLMKHPFVEDINDEMSRRPMAADGKEQTNGADEGRKQQTDVKG